MIMKIVIIKGTLRPLTRIKNQLKMKEWIKMMNRLTGNNNNNKNNNDEMSVSACLYCGFSYPVIRRSALGAVHPDIEVRIVFGAVTA